MAFTFNLDLSRPLDRVRQYVGDTDADHPELQDETITAYLAEDSNPLSVAYKLALDLAAKYSRVVEVTVDHQTSRGQQVADNYRKLAASLYSQLQSSGAGATEALPGIWATGIGDTSGPYDVPTIPQLC